MPQNTPMKRQFTTIDGRTVMSNLPQHWGGNDWKITGVDNPLPVGNYVQTESGVWIPQKGSDDGAAHVRLTGSNVELIFTRAQTLVPSGVNMGVSSAINVSKYKYVFIQFAPGGSAGLNQYKLHIRTLRGDTTSAFRQITVLDGQSGSNNETDFINVKSLNIAVYVENLTSEDRTFDYIHLFGVRA